MKPISKQDLARYYQTKFTPPVTDNLTDLESVSSSEPELSLTESNVYDRLTWSKEGLYRLIEIYLDNDPKLKMIADQIVQDGGDPLRAVANNDAEYLNNNPDKTSLLEVLVQTDGSRPSFLIKDGKVDTNSSPIGEWASAFANAEDKLHKAIECVGRINLGQRHVGTGFMINRDIIMTNRHVLQSIAVEGNDKTWKMNPAANIDFGYEFKSRISVNPRRLEKLIYCGPRKIDVRQIDHSKLDMAILEMEIVSDEMIPASMLNWDESTTWAFPDTQIFTIGYPGDPGLKGINTYTATLLDQLFKSTYGYKRIAPGKVMPFSNSDQKITITHDATTLGGNSGSVILARPNEYTAAGLHYGGDTAMPRQNWGHILGSTLSIIMESAPSIYEYLHQKVQFINTGI